MILSTPIKSLEHLEVTLKCEVSNNQLENNTSYDFFAQIKEDGVIRIVSPEMLSKKQIEMTVQEYIENGRCEFFKYVRPNHMFKLIKQVNYHD